MQCKVIKLHDIDARAHEQRAYRLVRTFATTDWLNGADFGIRPEDMNGAFLRELYPRYLVMGFTARTDDRVFNAYFNEGGAFNE